VKKAKSKRRAETPTRAALRRRDRARAEDTLDDQFFELWQRIVDGLLAVLAGRRSAGDVARLEQLSLELEAAQRRRQLPPGLVRRLHSHTSDGPLRSA